MIEISKEIGLRWNKLLPEDKRPFEDLAKLDKERF
jgi:hypothetical protein